MSPLRHLTTAAVAALATGALAVPAAADTQVASDPTARNVTTYGSTAAWSRRDADGTYRLVVRSGGVASDAPVPPKSTPFDPDLGPTSSNGRVVVYSRTADNDSDIFSFTVGAAAEERVEAVSRPEVDEFAPSYYKGAIAFARREGSGPGLYLARPGKVVKRIFRTVPLETDLAATRVIGRWGEGTRSIIRILNYTGADVRIVARAKTEQRVTSPTLSRFNGFWLRVGRVASTVERTGVNAHRTLTILKADRALPAGTDALGVTSIPELYSGSTGVQHLDPTLRFAGST
jgi:hypothetical protein